MAAPGLRVALHDGLQVNGYQCGGRSLPTCHTPEGVQERFPEDAKRVLDKNSDS